MKSITAFITSSVFIISSLAQTTAMAAPSNAAMGSTAMEVITVTYRSPLDYAVYQYTTELLSYLKLQVRAEIYTQARSSSMQMADSIDRQLKADRSAWNTPNTHNIWSGKLTTHSIFQ